jgi:hypothetical protein
VLRCQLIVLRRQMRSRAQFTNTERLFFLQLYRWFPSIMKAMTTIRPETLVRWHRAGAVDGGQVGFDHMQGRDARGRPTCFDCHRQSGFLPTAISQ